MRKVGSNRTEAEVMEEIASKFPYEKKETVVVRV